jgi:adrenodoxin-NADP+ reductase
LLLKASSTSSSSKPQPHKSFNLAFFWSPIQFQDGPETRGNLGSVLFQHQSFADGADPFDPSASVKPVLDDTKSIETLLAFRSIGYKSTPLAGLSDLGIQFNSRKGVIPNEGGRIVRLPAGQPGMDVPQSLPGLYVAGWVKRGPTGVIASTMEDAFATADCIIQDINAGRSFLNGHLANKEMLDGWEGVQNELQNQGIDARRTSWKDWRRIDEVERERGAKQGKEREKITSIGEMLKVLDG